MNTTQTKSVFASLPRIKFNLDELVGCVTDTPQHTKECVTFLLDWATPECFAATPPQLITGNASLLEIALKYWLEQHPNYLNSKGFKTFTALYFLVQSHIQERIDNEHAYCLSWCCKCGIICDLDHIIICEDRGFCPDCDPEN